jgi:hypothetical protein
MSKATYSGIAQHKLSQRMFTVELLKNRTGSDITNHLCAGTFAGAPASLHLLYKPILFLTFSLSFSPFLEQFSRAQEFSPWTLFRTGDRAQLAVFQQG